MLTCLHKLLATRKRLPDSTVLDDWSYRELIHFAFLMSCRLLRGFYRRWSLKKVSGFILCEKNVRIYHGRHVSAGRALNLEEGCEIVGLSQKGIVFGDRCTVGRFASIRPTNVLFNEAGEGLVIGNDSNIGPYSWVGCSGYVRIGDNVMMGPRVNLLAENHCAECVDIPMKQQGVKRAGIIIEDDCWLGAGSSILAGVAIGRGSIIATGAVVTKDVAPFSVVGGVPATVIKKRGSSET